MELGEDVHTGREINPVEYEARTLHSDLKSSSGKPLDLEFCLDVGEKLSEALRHLHGVDLAHRDIKPANVIFVDGKAKLADIGLVAARGQQTFVGTEGFVPPEGPGSGQADIYSLVKVLYEMVTGKDRLQFPELPDSLPQTVNRKQWLAMNQVICSVCEPKLSKRNINTAKQLNDALKKIQQGKKVRERRLLSAKRGVLLVMLLALIPACYFAYHKWLKVPDVVVETPDEVVPKFKHEFCSVQFITDPHQAKVFENGLEVGGETPTAFRQYPPGTKVLYRFEKSGYMTLEKEYLIPDKEYEFFQEKLATFRPPKENEEWVDSVGARYFPRVGFHESGFIQEIHYRKFLATKPKVDAHQVETFSERGQTIRVVLLNKETAEKYARWIEAEAQKKGLLGDDQYVVAKQDESILLGPADLLEQRSLLKLYPTRGIAKDIPYASVDIKSTPEGARVYINDEWMGVTPMVAENVRPEKMIISLRKEGYKVSEQEIDLADNAKHKHFATLKPNSGVTFDADWEEKYKSGEEPSVWTNGMDVKMAQFDDTKRAAIWEVQVKEYAVFTNNTGHRTPKPPGFPQKDNHPVVGVSKKDAIAFCKWLTEKERKDDRIGARHEYRIPTDLEWSKMCGLKIEKGAFPALRVLNAQRDPQLRDRYPWGRIFPPRKKVANLADQAAAKAAGVSTGKVIKDYNDGFVNTAAVGSLLPNEYGIHDLAGNVYEWVSDNYSKGKALDVARGGSWATYNENNLKIWSRFPTQPEYRDNLYGFRYILVTTSE